MSRLRNYLIPMALAASIVATGAHAGIFDDPKNLQVLPKHISPQELRQTMRKFSMDVGLACEDCHVGQPDQPVDTFDFASDDRDLKEVARLMLRMMTDINDRQLAKLDRRAQARVSVQCVTCHRGQRRPLQMVDELDLAYAEDGVAAAISRYRLLKAELFGRGSHDFGEGPRLDFARLLAGRSDVSGAIVFLRELHDEHGASFMTDLMLGDLLLADGDRAAAIRQLEAALRVAPPDVRERIQSQIEGLRP
jgi:hypothetical protein